MNTRASGQGNLSSPHTVLVVEDDEANRQFLCALLEAESFMPDIFTAGSTGTDGRAIDEIHHYCSVADKGDGIPEHVIINFARTRVPMQSILRIIEIMVASGKLKSRGEDRFGKRWFRYVKRDEDGN